MPTLETASRPKGQSDEYLFVADKDTGARFKVKHQMLTNAGAQPTLQLTLSPVSARGKALLNAAGEPDVTTHVHVFTAVELSDPDFDEEARIAAIIEQLATEKQREISGRNRVLSLGSKWRRGRIDFSKGAAIRPEQAGEKT